MREKEKSNWTEEVETGEEAIQRMVQERLRTQRRIKNGMAARWMMAMCTGVTSLSFPYEQRVRI